MTHMDEDTKEFMQRSLKELAAMSFSEYNGGYFGEKEEKKQESDEERKK